MTSGRTLVWFLMGASLLTGGFLAGLYFDEKMIREESQSDAAQKLRRTVAAIEWSVSSWCDSGATVSSISEQSAALASEVQVIGALLQGGAAGNEETGHALSELNELRGYFSEVASATQLASDEFFDSGSLSRRGDPLMNARAWAELTASEKDLRADAGDYEAMQEKAYDRLRQRLVRQVNQGVIGAGTRLDRFESLIGRRMAAISPDVLVDFEVIESAQICALDLVNRRIQNAREE